MNSAEDAILELASVIKDWPRTTLIVQTADYLRFEVRSLIFRFVDDIEFLRDHDFGVIHVRSAARWGFYDLGVNRRRIGQLREAWNQRQLRARPEL